MVSAIPDVSRSRGQDGGVNAKPATPVASLVPPRRDQASNDCDEPRCVPQPRPG